MKYYLSSDNIIILALKATPNEKVSFGIFNFSATSLRSIFSFLACIKHAKNFAPYNFFIPYDARKVIDKINTFLKAILWLLSLLYMWKQ